MKTLDISDSTLSLEARALYALAAQFDAIGYPGSAMLVEAKLPTAAPPDERLPIERILQWGELVEGSGKDPDIGLHLGIRIPFGTRPLLDNLFAAAATFGDALSIVDRFGHVPTRSMGWKRLPDVGEMVTYVVTQASGLVLQRWHLDLLVARAVSDLRYVLRQHICSAELTFSYARPASTRVHRELLGGRLRFGAEFTSFSLPKQLLSLPLPNSNPGLYDLLENLALRDERERQARPIGMLPRLRSQIAAELTTGITLDGAARALGTSGRTLRRRLAEEGTSFHAELAAVRRELALQYLRRTDLSLADVSYLLGFANVTAFHRAFKRWTGRTAADYRGSENVAIDL